MNKNIKSTEKIVQVEITAEEYNKHISTLNFFDTTRNNLLTFAFTTVLALLGIIIASENPINPLVCLVPYFLIIPFTARISYYRIASAHINTFLKSFVPEKTVFANGASIVPEKHGKVYPLIAWLINHEMVVLAIATGLIYCYEYYNYDNFSTLWSIIKFLAPIPFIIVIFLISNSTYSYKKICDVYTPKWETYLEKLKRNNEQL